MLNSIQMRKLFLTDVCNERVLPERPSPQPRRVDGENNAVNEEDEGRNGETVEDPPDIAPVGVVRVALPPVNNGVVKEEIWGVM